jgi:uncharacterized GH25 family protein
LKNQPEDMRRISIFLILLAAAFTIAATIPDFFLVPANFFLHKGDQLDLHLLSGDAFTKQEEFRFQPEKTGKFVLYEGSKKTDLAKVTRDTALHVLNYKMDNPGLALLEMTRNTGISDESQDNYADFLTAQGLTKYADKVKNGSDLRIREKDNRYLKTLINVDNPSGSIYEKVLNQTFEIILKRNPYKASYGDDMTAQLWFKGKPLKGGTVKLYIKSASGAVYPQVLLTDEKGIVNFTLNREGIYMITSVIVEATKDKDADYESWWTSFTFGFANSGDLPNSYKSFGFGDRH